jgi:diguanylate cyclase
MQQPEIDAFSGQFTDPSLETNFRLATRAKITQQTRISLLTTATLFLLIGVLDYHYLGLGTSFYLLIAMRVLVAVSCLLLIRALVRDPSLIDNPVPTNAVLILLVTCAILVVPLRPETINTQFTAAMTLTMVLYFFIPNRLSWTLGICIYLGLGFLVTLYFWSPFNMKDTLIVGLVLLIPNIVGVIYCQRLNQLEREQFSALSLAQQSNTQLQHEIRERKRLEEELRHLAQIDHLTGLNNRRWFLELARHELRSSRRIKSPLSVCMVDMDNFKCINDQKGHAAGDLALVLVAELCRESLRDSDIIGRFGGEEFVIALPRATIDEAQEIAERLRKRIETFPLPEELKDVSLSVTIGITEVNPDETSLEPALLRADNALYSGKSKGRNTVIIATDAPSLISEAN